VKVETTHRNLAEEQMPFKTMFSPTYDCFFLSIYLSYFNENETVKLIHTAYFIGLYQRTENECSWFLL